MANGHHKTDDSVLSRHQQVDIVARSQAEDYTIINSTAGIIKKNKEQHITNSLEAAVLDQTSHLNKHQQIRLQPFTKDMLINDSPSMLSRKTVISRDLSEISSPPEKRLKQQSPDDCSSSTTTAPTANPRKSAKGGKGIRNRVFCGDCPGCLKNDDCGQCRYCRDKTKFGGQNRLRQKCLHRRCQMDTHRRPPPPTSVGTTASSGHGIVSSTLVNSTTGEQATIYSGVDLARLTSGDTVVEEARDRSSPYGHILGKDCRVREIY